MMAPSASAAAIETFCKALAFNWVVFGPDAHAKNYSMLLSGPQAALAPLYDISSVVPYPDRYDLRHMAMAMAINGKYENALVTGEDWAMFAGTIKIEPERMLDWVEGVVTSAPDAMADAVRAEDDRISTTWVAKELVAGVKNAAKARLRWLRI